MSFSEVKIALVFDWMTNQGGAEKVNFKLHKMFPEAPIYTSIYNPEKLKGFEKAKIHTSFIQNLPFAKTKHQIYVGLMPYAYELFDLSKYDIVISSSHACAKGIITKPETLHICYCHSPMRYAWDNWHSYIKEYKMNPLIKKLAKRRIHKLRIWDRLSAERVDAYIANSSTTQKRIKKYYGKESEIIHPSIKIKDYSHSPSKGYFLAVGRLTPYKKFNLLVDTFNQNGLPLKIVGTGILEQELRIKAKSNVELLGFVKEDKLKKLYSECEAFIFPQLEDFGITPLEAMASGKPVIAYSKGGSLDTIVEDKTGVFFHKQTPKSIKEAITRFKKQKWDPNEIRQHAQKFDHKNFENSLMAYIKDQWQKHSETY